MRNRFRRLILAARTSLRSPLLAARPFLAALGLAAVLGVAACTTPPPPKLNLPEITFNQQPAMIFTAERVEYAPEYKSPFQAPNIEHTLAQSPSKVIERWMSDRIQIDNSRPYTLRVIVKDARVTEEDLARTPGLRGSFTTDQAYRFETSVEVAVDIRDERGFRLGEASAGVKKSNTLAENATLNDRDTLIYNLVKDTMVELDRELTRNIRSYMPLYVR